MHILITLIAPIWFNIVFNASRGQLTDKAIVTQANETLYVILGHKEFVAT